MQKARNIVDILKPWFRFYSFEDPAILTVGNLY